MTTGQYMLWNWFGAATWPMWLLLAGYILNRFGRLRLGKWTSLCGLALFLAIAATPLSLWLMRPLEAVFPQSSPRRAGTIIMLAGAEQLNTSLRSGQPEYSEAAERVIAAVALQKQHPSAVLVLVGGIKLPGGREDVAYASETARALGIPQSKLLRISGTKNSCENARGAASMLPRQAPMILVTSAFHMPRAMLCFRKYGLSPIAYPVDFRTPGPQTLAQQYSLRLIGNFKRFDDAMHEWIGLAIYRLQGRIDRLWPN